ncbi:hypothetical protein BDQ12DRAFT_682300 [Crucibulum laeve]|uniref:DUF6699 domain-containing protein n=1 Tax=Crucibulum laeve TaxID=68775 RepID=A0A5C3MDG0_9AGAR|nr:hypothetical protein BDQ12DRAFT_682300 [Crucibulum laeve]
MDQHPLHTLSTRASENVASSSQSPSDRTSSSRQAHRGSIQVIPSQRDEQFRASSRGYVYSEAPNTSSNAIHLGGRGGEELLFPLNWHLAYTNNHISSSESPSGNTETASVVSIPEQSGDLPPALPRHTNAPLPPLTNAPVALNPHLLLGVIRYNVATSPMTAICWNIAPTFGPWWLQPATFPITQSMVIRTSIVERPIVVHPSDERHAVVMVWDVLQAVHDAVVAEGGERFQDRCNKR